jgi:hypothetical protein
VHCAAHTGEVVSKRDAGHYALDTFAQEWHPVVALALESRTFDHAEVRVADLRTACDFVARVAGA